MVSFPLKAEERARITVKGPGCNCGFVSILYDPHREYLSHIPAVGTGSAKSGFAHWHNPQKRGKARSQYRRAVVDPANPLK